MRRNPSKLAQNEYDIVIAGGGIVGAATAWEAASRGLSVALVERDDFASGASGNCFKTIHGGLRYLSRLDLRRMWASSAERSTLARIIPELVEPMPFILPTYGWGRYGPLPLSALSNFYDGLTPRRNRGIVEPYRQFRSGTRIGTREALELFPSFPQQGLRGAQVIFEAQMRDPARIALSFLHSAVEAGAHVANHVEATRLRSQGGRVVGLEIRDNVSGAHLEIAGRITVDATGGTATSLGVEPAPRLSPRRAVFSRDLCLVLHRTFDLTHTIGLPIVDRSPHSVAPGRRFLFLSPWQEHTLLGTWHTSKHGPPNHEEVRSCLDQANAACPELALSMDDVALVQWGPVLLHPGDDNARFFDDRSLSIDHRERDGIDGWISLLGLRFTTARRQAECTVDLALQKLGRPPEQSRTAEVRLSTKGIRECLTRPGQAVSEANVTYAIDEEMALTLADIAFRRTGLATAGDPGHAALRSAANYAATKLGWDEARTEREIDDVRAAIRGVEG